MNSENQSNAEPLDANKVCPSGNDLAGDERDLSQRDHQAPYRQASYHRPHDRRVAVPVGLDSDQVVMRPSLRMQRRNFTFAVTLFTIGSLGIVLSSPWNRDFLSPGPLSSHHAPLAFGETGNRCAACHANANGSLGDWIGSVFRSSRHAGVSQSELCMKCHDATINSQYALNPHNVSPDLLAEKKPLSETTSPFSLVSSRSILKPPVDHHQQIGCSSCHQEHHGGHNLSTLTDNQCQSCHGQVFHSFENGHPEFIDYPLKRRSRIAFDHASHFGQHFPDKEMEFNCAMCHIDDSQRNVKRLASFEQSCAQCHNDQILDSTSSGLALLALPQLDMTAIEEAGLDVGGWPLAATGDFDGQIPPMMRLMLLDDERAKEILERRGPKFEFFDLDADQSADVADAVELVWAIKRLMAELSAQGPFAIQEKIQSVLGLEVSNDQLSRMITTLDGAVFRISIQVWLPGLASDLERKASLADYSLPPEQLGLEQTLLVKQQDDSQDVLDSVFKLASQSKPMVEPMNSRLAGRSIDAEDSWLAVNPLAELMGTGSQPQVLSTPPNDDTVVRGKPGQPPVAALPSNDPIEPKLDPHDPVAALAQAIVQRPANESNAELFNTLTRPSGWHRNDRTMQIVYRPTGHADPCLQNWIEFVSRIPNVDQRPETQHLYEDLLHSSGLGECRSCHTADQQDDQTLLVNWVAEYRDPAIRGFTRFSHGPHLIQPELQDCSHCHQLDSNRSNAETFVGFDAGQFRSNFRPVSISDCTSCHQKGRTDSGCTQCHNYHVGSTILKGR